MDELRPIYCSRDQTKKVYMGEELKMDMTIHLKDSKHDLNLMHV